MRRHSVSRWLGVIGLTFALVGLGGQGMTGAQTSLAETRQHAEQGDAAAQYILGVSYAAGEGVPQDYAHAVAWVRKAADQGLAVAQFNLGYMYTTGQGVPQDDAQAVVWVRKAADQGLAAAQFNLGGMYATGRGVPLDYVEALKWSNLAVIRATGDTQNQYAASRDALAMLMTPAQIFEAQQRAAEWQADFEKRQAE